MNTRNFIPLLVGGAATLLAAFLFVLLAFCAFYVPPDKMAVMIRKTGAPLPPGNIIAEPGQKGIQRDALGPGLYFRNPLVWDREMSDLVEISAGDPATWVMHYASGGAEHAVPEIHGQLPEIGVVTSLAGKPWDQEIEVVEPGYQGIQREVLTPGVYRLNPRAYKVEKRPAIVIPLGCAGVVTSRLGTMPEMETVAEKIIGPDGEPVLGETKVVQKLAEEGQRGILRNVLPPGIYYLNPYVYKVTLVQVGYNQISQMRAASPTDDIRFPSRDGFTIEVEVTVVWGRHPEHAPEMIARFGDVSKLESIILSQIRSICRNLGSEYDSTDFIRGEKREQYQIAVTETLRRVAKERDLEILIALIQNIYVQGGTEGDDLDLKETIQRGFIAKEEEISRQREREAAVVKAQLETAKAQIEVAREQVRAETRKKVAEILADGEKQAAEIDARRDLAVAKIERQIATLDAEQALILGQANASVERMKNQAEAEGRRMLIEAFGTGHAFNLYTFAQDFQPQDIRLLFAGEGTLWTDLKSVQDAAAIELLRDASPAQK